MTAPRLHSCPSCSCAVVDEIAVERAVRGDREVPLNGTEMLEAFRYLDAHGRSLHQIAAILGVTARSVSRWRAGVIPRARQIAQRLDTTPRSVTRWRGKAAS